MGAKEEGKRDGGGGKEQDTSGCGCRAGVVVGPTERSVGPTSKKAQKECKATKATIKCKSDH